MKKKVLTVLFFVCVGIFLVGIWYMPEIPTLIWLIPLCAWGFAESVINIFRKK